jgi:hypothetical protein
MAIQLLRRKEWRNLIFTAYFRDLSLFKDFFAQINSKRGDFFLVNRYSVLINSLCISNKEKLGMISRFLRLDEKRRI